MDVAIAEGHGKVALRGPEAMRPYLRAKADADAALVVSGLDVTIVRAAR